MSTFLRICRDLACPVLALLVIVAVLWRSACDDQGDPPTWPDNDEPGGVLVEPPLAEQADADRLIEETENYLKGLSR